MLPAVMNVCFVCLFFLVQKNLLFRPFTLKFIQLVPCYIESMICVLVSYLDVIMPEMWSPLNCMVSIYIQCLMCLYFLELVLLVLNLNILICLCCPLCFYIDFCGISALAISGNSSGPAKYTSPTKPPHTLSPRKKSKT